MSIIVMPPKNQNSPGTLSKKKKKNRRGKKGGKPKAPPRNQRANVVAVRQKQFFRLSPCSELYLKALVDPFTTEGGHACIPDLIDFPSFKYLCILRGTMNIGTLGVGFVFLDSLAVGNNTGPAVVTTTSLYAGPNVPPLTSTVGVASITWSNQPFQFAQFSPNGLQVRVVGVGLRVRYTGTELNRSGRLIPYRTQNTGPNLSLSGEQAATFLSRPEVPSISCDREWVHVTYLPTSSTDFNYTSPTSIGASFTGIDLGVYVDGAVAGNGFEWEVYGHYEVYASDPADSPPGVSKSHSDVAGMSGIRNALEGDLPIALPEDNFAYLKRVIRDYTPEDMSSILSEMVKTGKALAPLLM